MAHKILVVDDEPDMQRLMTQIFRPAIRSGELTFVFAENGAIALEKLTGESDIDIVFTDINMPVMDGLTLLTKMRENNLLPKTVVISAYGDLQNIRTAMNSGAFDFVTKPIDFVDLEKTLAKAIGEMKIFKQGLEARNNLEEAQAEKVEAQQQALLHLQEKEKLILRQNEMLEMQVAERTMQVVHQKELLELKNKEILDSIRYARRLQEAILPNEKTFGNYFPESFVLYLPKDIVAGDFYWIEEVEKYVLVAVADCTGHGVSGALMSMLGISLLNQIVHEKGITEPSAILNQLDNLVVSALRQTENDTHDGMDIALCRFDKDKKEVQYAGANRPLYRVHNREMIVIAPDKIPIGGMQVERKNNFTTHPFPMEKGDILYLFTDGYADQFGGELGKKMMSKNFRETILKNHHAEMNKQSALLNEHFEKWRGNHEQVDDVLVAGIKI